MEKVCPDFEITLTDATGNYIFHQMQRAVRFLSYHTQLDKSQVEFLLKHRTQKIGQFTVEY